MLADIISRLSVDNRVEPEDTLDWSIQVFSIFQTQCSGEHKLKLLCREKSWKQPSPKWIASTIKWFQSNLCSDKILTFFQEQTRFLFTS